MIRDRGGYWQVKVYVGLDPLTGKHRFEYDRARTKREAQRVEAALKTKVAEGRHRGTAAVGAENPSTSCDLGIFVDQPAEAIQPHDRYVGRWSRW
jgi:Arm DNA-binding domain